MSNASTLSVDQICQPVPAIFSHAEILKVIFGVMICILLAALDQAAVIPAVPAIAQELGAYEQLSWIVAAYLITSTISTPIYGKLSDIYGRRRLLIICIAFFIATSSLCAAAQSLSQLIWFRALQGLAGGGLMALTQAVIADVVSPRERDRYQVHISTVGQFLRCVARSSAASWPSISHGGGYSGSTCQSARLHCGCAMAHCADCHPPHAPIGRGLIFSVWFCLRQRYRSYCWPLDGAAEFIPGCRVRFWVLSVSEVCCFSC